MVCVDLSSVQPAILLCALLAGLRIYANLLLCSSQQLYFIHTLQMKKVKHDEFNQFIQSVLANKYMYWAAEASTQTSEVLFLASAPHSAQSKRKKFCCSLQKQVSVKSWSSDLLLLDIYLHWTDMWSKWRFTNGTWSLTVSFQHWVLQAHLVTTFMLRSSVGESFFTYDCPHF